MSTSTSTDLIIPKLNEYWPGQGGFFRGAHLLGGFLIEAADFLPKRYQFGNYGKVLKGYSDLDGAENTRKLVEIDSPAAKAAAEYTADGHADFFLPAQRELMQAFLATGCREQEPFSMLSSTPYGSHYAWAVVFKDVSVGRWHRDGEFRVRPFRRFIR